MRTRRPGIFCVCASLVALSAVLNPLRADEPGFKRTEDVIYGRKPGLALTMDVFTPDNANGLGVVLVVSGGWFSAHEAIKPEICGDVLKRGYTVFAVVHGSQPKFAIPEILLDMNRAVRYIRHHAADYKVDPQHLGIMGASAGGHLSLMQGTAGNEGDPKAADPVDRESSRVQSVACFFPPTDFLNYGKPGEIALGRGVLAPYRGAFDFQRWDEPTHHFVEITDEAEIEEIGKQISPIYQVSADDPPTLIIHGDADTLVPIQQAQTFLEKLKGVGVKTELVVKPGAAHGWPDLFADTAKIADWFDANLKGEVKSADARFKIPASDEDLPGAGPIRRQDWMQKTWKERRQHFSERDAQDKNAVVFFGDSITQGWSDDFRGKFAGAKLANRGISGDTTRGMLLRLKEDVLALDPKGVVMLMGTNDLDENAEPATIAGNIKLIVDELKKHDAKMPVVLCLVMPSSETKNRPADKIRQLNALLREAVKDEPQVEVLDTWTMFANDAGDAKPEEFPDLLHPNDAGYDKWAAALQPLLAKRGLIDAK